MTVGESSSTWYVMKSLARPRALNILAFGGLLAFAAVAAIWGRAMDRHPSPSYGLSERVRAADPPTSRAARPAAQPAQAPPLFAQSITHQGIAVEFSVQHLDPTKQRTKELQEGDDVRIRFTITDTASGKPVRSLNPAAWMDLIPPNEIRGAKTCEQKAKAFLGGSIFGKAELDLNVFNVLTLNREATISVVDPLFSFGGTKLLGMVVLESPGEDWVINASETRVYVSLPESHKVAVVDTAGWEVAGNIDLGRRPGRLALQPDERLLWVADDEAGAEAAEPSGIAAIETSQSRPVGRVVTGRGPHEMAFSDDGRWAFVTNERDGTVSIVDAQSLKKVKDLSAGTKPASVAFSALAKMVYVTSGGDGTISVIDGERREVVTRIKADPGLAQLKFAPGGRLAFIVNPARDLVHILDAATNRIVQTADVDDEPYQVAFSEEIAYVRHRGSAEVLMMPLRAVGVEKQRVQVIAFPGGQIPPGKSPRLSPADAIVQAPGENAVLVANPMDKAVYYYREGMAAPMGNFSNYGREPRAVLVVDRSLRERGSPGVYETAARMRRPGDYDVVFLLDSPRIVHCFLVTVKPNESLESQRNAGKIRVEHLVEQRRVAVGEIVRLSFRLTDQRTKVPVAKLTDVEVLTNLMPGIWHKRHVASPEGDGLYVLDFAPPRPGLYYIYLQCLSHGLSFNNDQYLVLEAVPRDEPSQND
jgi:YVTN family beta-propeller protein